MSNYLFRAKTTEGYLFKVIADILQNNQNHRDCLYQEVL